MILRCVTQATTLLRIVTVVTAVRISTFKREATEDFKMSDEKTRVSADSQGINADKENNYSCVQVYNIYT